MEHRHAWQPNLALQVQDVNLLEGARDIFSGPFLTADGVDVHVVTNECQVRPSQLQTWQSVPRTAFKFIHLHRVQVSDAIKATTNDKLVAIANGSPEKRALHLHRWHGEPHIPRLLIGVENLNRVQN